MDSENLEYLKKYQAWRRGELEGTMDELGLTAKRIGEVIDWAIEKLSQPF